MTSPSSIGREAECLAAAVYPHSRSVGPRAIRGKDLHAFLCAVALIVALNGTPEYDEAFNEALESVPEEWRPSAAAIDFSRIPPLSPESGVPELALIWNLKTDEVREVGRAGSVDHDQMKELVGPGEYGGIIDFCYLTDDAVGVWDWKTGYSVVDKAEVNGQLRSYAVLAAKLFKREKAHLAVVRIPDNGNVWWNHATLDSMGLDSAEAFVRQHLKKVEAAVAAYRSEDVIPPPVEGTWCNFCPAFNDCRAKTGLLRAAMYGDANKLLERLTDEDAGLAWVKAKAFQKVVEVVLEKLKDRAKVHGSIPLPNGNVLGEVETEMTSFEPVFARAPLEARFGVEGANFAIRTTEKLTRKAIDELVRANSNHGGQAKLTRTVLAELDAAGAVRTVKVRRIGEAAATSKRLKAAPEAPQLPAGETE